MLSYIRIYTLSDVKNTLSGVWIYCQNTLHCHSIFKRSILRHVGQSGITCTPLIMHLNAVAIETVTLSPHAEHLPRDNEPPSSIDECLLAD